ncbi:MAG TPA: hypothetical protein VFN88_07025 [Caulobacteraceae bacterium]|nr:hypothetical protein [Caulobacteraceae bacterium]
MMLLAFSLMAAAPVLGLSLWIIDETYGQRLVPRRLVERARAYAERHR